MRSFHDNRPAAILTSTQEGACCFLNVAHQNYSCWSPTASCGADAAREARQVLWEVGTMWASRPLAIKKDGRIDTRIWRVPGTSGYRSTAEKVWSQRARVAST